MPYPTRSLGRGGPQVPAIGFGTMGIGVPYGQLQNTTEDKLEVLNHAHEIGARFWDTADVYADSEERIGEWFKKTGKRNDIFLATKFGLDYSTGNQTVRSDPEYVKVACDRSLEKMGIETIDLYYVHRVDDVTPIEKTIEAMVELKKEGKIKYLGLSECSAATIRRAHAIHPIAAYEVEYNPFTLEIESPKTEILNTCRELGVAIVAYSPVGRGLLTGQIKSFDDLAEGDFRRLTPKYSRENFPAILRLVAGFQKVAMSHNCSPAQACLAWLLAQGDDIIPLPGTRTVKYLDQNMEAAYVKLTDAEIKELRQQIEATELSGDRYPTSWMGPIYADTPAL